MKAYHYRKSSGHKGSKTKEQRDNDIPENN